MERTFLEGGCFCGAVRYRAAATAYTGSSVCQCSNCRCATGAPFAAFVNFETDTLDMDKFRFMKGEPIRYRYTSELAHKGRMLWSERWFCGQRGT